MPRSARIVNRRNASSQTFFAQRSQKTEIRGNAKEGERPACPRNPSRKDAKAQRKTAKSKKVKGEKRHGSTLRLLAALLKSFPQKFPARTPRRKEKPQSQKKLKKSFKGERRLSSRFLEILPEQIFPRGSRRRELSFFPDHESSRKSPRKSAETTVGTRNLRTFP